jgi:hypothetical protein
VPHKTDDSYNTREECSRDPDCQIAADEEKEDSGEIPTIEILIVALKRSSASRDNAEVTV